MSLVNYVIKAYGVWSLTSTPSYFRY